MKEEAMQDVDLNVSNFRVITAAFFGIMAVVMTFFVDSVLYYLGVSEILPIFKSVLLAAVVASIFAALFAGKIFRCDISHKRCIFGWGFFMTIIGLPFYNLGLVMLMYFENPEAYSDAPLYMLFHVYLFTFTTIFILVGLWLAIIAGFLAIYLRKKLAPDIMHSENMNRELPVGKQTKMHESKTPHRHKKD